MAPGNPFESHPDTSSCSETLNCLEAILRAARLKTASASSAAQGVQERLQRPAVEINQEDDDFCHSGAWQNRKLPGEKQPFLAQFFVRCRGSTRLRGNHHQPSGVNQRSMEAANLAQTATDPVAHDRTANAAGSDETEPGRAVSRSGAQTQKTPLDRAAFRTNKGKLPAEANPRVARKTEFFRRRYGGQNESLHPSARGACGHAGGGGSRWLVRFWSSYGHESQTASCACACSVDRCVS